MTKNELRRIAEKNSDKANRRVIITTLLTKSQSFATSHTVTTCATRPNAGIKCLKR